MEVNQEGHLPLELLPSINQQSGENINECTFPQEDRAEENRQRPFEEEPGCSVDLYLENNEQHDGSSDTDNSSDWESMDKVSTKNYAQELKAGLDENSATDVTGNNQQHQCAQCFRSFRSESILKIHVKRHIEQGPFTSQTCNKVYSHKTSYTQHLRIHSAQNPFTCSICNGCSDTDNATKCNGQELKAGHSKNSATKSVISKDRPNRNPRKNSLQPTHKCSDCGMKFSQRQSLIRHIRNTHNKERPHRCSVCQKVFFRKYALVNHMRKHTGELPFRCSVCDRGYLYKQSLRDHKCSQSQDGGQMLRSQPLWGRSVSSTSETKLFGKFKIPQKCFSKIYY
uniref:C2H2-type domain-containing protein n=1 Tax=Neogobius melanostomus TaxID=47308 RepID=A0A8C6TJH4_9GOBI